ncbi:MULTISPECIES: hypothetical protein [Cyanophyceae]|uniref:hypothetical protein n=1 Tax=Cyanophyceae TaxID=3028117 RepID=UPI00168771D2|nr:MULTISPECIES: hypothetical protein [Cyanophyceae]MBD1917432.1 hypothetical protein [Phormidium sp. FACHB-77]MBD2032323.1 hypothetical protein [Phormidium sp. FACHB-322]MBD2052261.1 hypothetical protein [Leptolyngbya sp. FACHB-60]
MKQPALPRDLNGQRLCQLFNYPWKWIETPSDTPKADWKTCEKYPLRPRVLWARWQDAATVIGTRFGPTTSHALIDIDAESDYIESTQRIKWALETIGITRTITVRSSWSGGLHIYIPFPHAYKTFDVACAVAQCLEAQGFVLAPGQLEVIPNRKAYARRWLGESFEYNGHRLPLQPSTGSMILDDDLQPHPRAYDLSVFFALWDNAVQHNDHYEILEALSIARGNHRRRRRKANGKAQEWGNDLKTVISEGWTGPGQTNDMLKAIATYGRVFEKLSGLELQRFTVRIALNAPGLNEWCNHLHELAKRCIAWARAVEKYYWPMGSEPLRERKSLVQVCTARADDARARIMAALKQLCLDGLNIGQRVKALAPAARCSPNTLYKNKDLWHPQPDSPAPTPAPQPPPQSDPLPRRVTAHGAAIADTIEAIRQQILESLQSTDTPSITRLGGENEVCILETAPLKNLKSGGNGRERERGKGLSTAPPPAPAAAGAPQWPPLEFGWQQGAVGDLHV